MGIHFPLTLNMTSAAELKRLPNDDYNRDVTAVAMDDRFYLIGQVDGSLSAVYISNGNNVFKSKISDSPITAVACEEKDDADNQIFYAGDAAGNLYTVNKKGNVVKTTSIPERKGDIHIIANKDKYQIYLYTTKGSQSLSHTTTDFRKGNFTTCAMEFGRKIGNYEEVLAYAIIDDEYENLVEDGTADKSFVVFSNGRQVRQMQFKSPVKQIMSCRHHEVGSSDDIYILLWNGSIYRINASKLADPDVEDASLGMVLVTKSEDNDDGSDSDDDDRGEFRGFCVYNNRICVYGNDGLFAANIQ